MMITNYKDRRSAGLYGSEEEEFLWMIEQLDLRLKFTANKCLIIGMVEISAPNTSW